MRFAPRRLALLAPLAAIVLTGVLTGCSKNHGELVVDDSVGVTALRSPCPTVAVPELTGDLTALIPGRTDAGAIDLTASITNLRSTCNDAAGQPKLVTDVSFDVLARRSSVDLPRRLEIPFFTVVMRGGTQVVAKRIGNVVIDFAAGQERATGHATATSTVDRAEATLPDEIRRRLAKKRRAGDPDAAVDPLAQPDVRAALARAGFETLVGFQLTQGQLAYNATR
ncbi:hypothetical protein [Novosphingobium sp.]|uniref:hypothetical protein n=1 Tax=Novosphingobium sp. TaxID=1874826 RepID=UPI0038BC17C4